MLLHTHVLYICKQQRNVYIIASFSLETKGWLADKCHQVVINYPRFHIVRLMCLNQRQIETIFNENAFNKYVWMYTTPITNFAISVVTYKPGTI